MKIFLSSSNIGMSHHLLDLENRGSLALNIGAKTMPKRMRIKVLMATFDKRFSHDPSDSIDTNMIPLFIKPYELTNIILFDVIHQTSISLQCQINLSSLCSFADKIDLATIDLANMQIADLGNSHAGFKSNFDE